MIIGLTGTFGSGKGEISKYLISLGFVHYSVTDYLIKEIQARNMIVNRDSMVKVANDLRFIYGPGILAERLLKQAFAVGHKNIVIESIRNPKEVEELRNYSSAYLIAVDAPIKLRYDRISLRNSSKDSVSFDEFQEKELKELNDTTPYAQRINECIKLADICISNEGTFSELHKEVDLFLESCNFQSKNI